MRSAAFLLGVGLLLSHSGASAQVDLNDILEFGRRLQILTQPAPQPVPQPAPQRSQPWAPQATDLTRGEVRQVQQQLAGLGYSPGPADGVAGRRTVAALAAFQRDRGLPATGWLDKDSYAAVATAWQQQNGSYRDNAETEVRRDVAPSGIEQPAVTTVLAPVAVDLHMLALRLDPDFASERDYVRIAAAQIAVEQAGGQPGRGGWAMFEPAEIDGRVPDFAAAELWPAFRDRLHARLSESPPTVTFAIDTALASLVYADGHIRLPDDQGGPDGPILGYGIYSPEDKLRLSPLGAREVMESVPTLWSEGAAPAPEALYQWSPEQSPVYRMAVDRVPAIPPLAMAPADAERLWLAAARYPDGAALRAVFTVEPQALQQEGDTVFILAWIIGARLFGPDGALLKEYAAIDLWPATDSWTAAGLRQRRRRPGDQPGAGPRRPARPRR